MKKPTIVLLAVVVLLLLAIFFWEKKQPSTTRIKEDAEKLFPSFPDKIVRIERMGFGDISLEKKNGEWRILSPISDAADNSSVEGFIEVLKGAKALRMVERSASPAGLGLSPAKIKVALTGEDGGKLLLEIGDSPPLEKGSYFRSGEKIGVIGDYTMDTVRKGLNDLRSRELLAPLKPEEVKGLSYIRNGKVVVSIESRDGRWFVTKPYEDEADAGKAYSFVEDVVLWPVMSFDDEIADLSFAGLFTPDERIELTTREGGKITASIGNMKDPEKNICYATVSNRKGVFAVSKNSVRMLGRDPEELRSLAVFPSDLYDAQRVEIAAKSKVVLNNGREKGWDIEGETGRGEEAKAAVFSLNDLRAEKLLPQGAKGILLAEVNAALRSGKCSVKLYDEGGTLFAERSGRAVLAQISKEDGDRLRAAILKLQEKKK